MSFRIRFTSSPSHTHALSLSSSSISLVICSEPLWLSRAVHAAVSFGHAWCSDACKINTRFFSAFAQFIYFVCQFFSFSLDFLWGCTAGWCFSHQHQPQRIEMDLFLGPDWINYVYVWIEFNAHIYLARAHRVWSQWTRVVRAQASLCLVDANPSQMERKNLNGIGFFVCACEMFIGFGFGFCQRYLVLHNHNNYYRHSSRSAHENDKEMNRWIGFKNQYWLWVLNANGVAESLGVLHKAEIKSVE